MNNPNRELDIKKIVLAMHKKIKNNFNSNSFFNENKIQQNWPLKKGSVEKKVLAWNFFESNIEVINAFVAFTIKAIAVGIKFDNLQSPIFKLEEIENENILKNIFMNKFISSFFWEDLKKYYQLYSHYNSQKETRTSAVQNILPHNSCVALCLDSVFFKLRSGMNHELSCFENLIEDLYNANNSLIIFSRQKLTPSNKKKLQVNNYSISFKMNKDIMDTSIYEALEPQSHLVQSKQFIDPVKTGCYDRLIALLSAGQNFIRDLEVKYDNWDKYTTTESSIRY